MNGERRDLDIVLDEALAEIRETALDPEVEREAGERVWARLRGEIAARPGVEEARHEIRDCGDFQTLIPAYLRGELSQARRLLLQDHLTECVPCRRVVKQSRDVARRRRPEAPAPAGWASRWGWRLAAAAVLLVALIGVSVRTDLLTLETGGLIHIEAVEGEAFRVLDDQTTPVSAGDTLSFEDTKLIRTGKGSRAMLRLEDGSRVEVSERAELAVAQRRAPWRRGRGDAVIELERGSVIVEASEQGSGHLFVDTDDAEVAVTGTVFAVNHGVKGSRVSVLEGEVHVAHDGGTDVLRPGDQATTCACLGRVPVEQEVAWSQQLEKHLELIRQFAQLGRDIDAGIRGPGRRFDTALLDRAPAGTMVYAAIPNLSAALDQAYELMQQRIGQNELLSGWWKESVVRAGADREIASAMEKIEAYGRLIGDEIVVAVGGTDTRGLQPLVYARALDPEALRALVATEIERLASADDERPDLRLLDANLLAAEPEADVYLWIGPEFLALSPSVEAIRTFAAGSGTASAFYGTAFHGRLADLYTDGVEWVVGVDVQALRAASGPEPAREQATLDALGISDLQHIIGEHEEAGGRSDNRAVLVFDQPRRGVASWLAEPAPMGALDFISPNAYFAAGFVIREPAQVFDELLEAFGAADSELRSGLAEFEQRYSIDVRQDIAAAIGGEFAFALDGPVLPSPSWKLVAEVYDPARLQRTVEWAVERMNELFAQQGKQGFAVEREEERGRTWYAVRSLDTGLAAHYVFVDGYLVASASRVLLDRALQFRNNGLTLLTHPAFVPLLPRDARVNFSALVFQNWGSIVEPLARGLRQTGPAANAEVQSMLGRLGMLTAPNLTLAYGEPNRIEFVNTLEGGLLGHGLSSLLSLHSLMDVQQSLGQAVEEEEAAGEADSHHDAQDG